MDHDRLHQGSRGSAFPVREWPCVLLLHHIVTNVVNSQTLSLESMPHQIVNQQSGQDIWQFQPCKSPMLTSNWLDYTSSGKGTIIILQVF